MSTPRPAPRARRRPRRRAPGGDRGAVSLELAIVFPLVMLTIFTIIQAGLWYHARSVALSAAQRGAERARIQGATVGQGTAAAEDFLSRAGSSIGDRSVTGSDGASVRIEVSGTVSTWIPGLSLPVRQHASAARERVTAP
ncbi:Flp pilus assembly protein TadG [Kitasatospora sp. MAA19]|uniref:TadE family protein n=1 Tax=Kitasatospora sp. MAA19 TaxID=3035090 RepID=UPI002474ABDC|nr:pilus assembly protein [Kitasatospora sp. MAA19]MDH6710909.1 Flp pilus assembly protein TadG [Kitasatospora sp. MAA19]